MAKINTMVSKPMKISNSPKEIKTDEKTKVYSFEDAKTIGEDIARRYPEIKLYLVEGHKGATEWTIRFTMPKSTPYYTRGVKWFDEEHQIASDRKKRWKCDKFGNKAFPENKEKAKWLSDILFKEW